MESEGILAIASRDGCNGRASFLRGITSLLLQNGSCPLTPSVGGGHSLARSAPHDFLHHLLAHVRRVFDEEAVAAAARAPAPLNPEAARLYLSDPTLFALRVAEVLRLADTELHAADAAGGIRSACSRGWPGVCGSRSRAPACVFPFSLADSPAGSPTCKKQHVPKSWAARREGVGVRGCI